MESKFFTLDEMLVSATGARLGIKNVLPEVLRTPMMNTMLCLDEVRKVLGHPIIVLSGYRSQQLNAAVKGSVNSWHCKAQAADILCPKFGTPFEVATAIYDYGRKNQLFKYHEIALEYNTWVHIAFPIKGQKPDMELLTINKKGTVWGLKP